MEILDIHTHHKSPYGILNEYPDSFMPEGSQYYSVGIHPWHITSGYESAWIKLQEAAAHPQVLAVGEVGLDKLAGADMLLQEEMFIRQIRLAERLGKPLVIHCVRSFNEIVLLKKKFAPAVPWIIHGFRGGAELVSQLTAQGLYISFGEKYKPEALAMVPPGRMFIETDESPEDITGLYRKASGYLSVPCGQFTDRIRQNIKDVFFSR